MDSSNRSMEVTTNLKMDAKFAYRPKVSPGEDSHFIHDDKQTVGVADGVGGWRKEGIDAGRYARQLTGNCLIELCLYTRKPNGGEVVNPKTLLKQAFEKTRAEGSSTACIITLRHHTLHAANVGDSGFMVFRNCKLVYCSPIQQHEFNYPFQLGSYCYCAKPEDAEVLKVEVQAGDVLVVGTDGLFDNMFPSEIEELIRNEGQKCAQQLASILAECAFNKSRGKKDNPYAQNARKVGFRHKGGKVDDITVIVAFIYVKDGKI